ncbi:MAG: flagellar motor protein MotD [Rhodocyclaceae bacterium]|jgi:chemotaxis protein MotB|nr:flagellar motor protein MotD [Rhodocyclaceae bacterium]MBK6553917.1 flagellar motor protein MotD [Rhodocyclaceae bacterium]MBK6678127.1 flagellar motor protein MotD [Rhodocyclaceae bacterium]MBK7813467.1 flagellar motor protein MotD [Rhodocyclaceae bacterium]MBK9310805.1 flagellar motor protein MotD [Rhodocyclaceae bacterium]
MARRRHGDEEHENHERWLVSYADFITLLFAFFVVMYAVSQVNEGKYRVLSDTLSSAFRHVPGSASGAQVAINPNAPLPVAIPLRRPSPSPKTDDKQRVKKEKMRTMAKEISEALAPLVKEGQVRITEGALAITVDINASVLFAPGDAHLDTGATQALTAVARILAPADFPVTVEGHTDNTPISTPMFPSNWELSGMRASTVVRLFVDQGVAPRRLTATGYADQRPVDDNATTEGRGRNRRVAITIESKAPDNPVEIRIP